MVLFVRVLAGESAQEDLEFRALLMQETNSKWPCRANLRTAWAPDDCIVCGFGASEVYAVNSWIVAKVLSFFTTAVNK